MGDGTSCSGAAQELSATAAASAAGVRRHSAAQLLRPRQRSSRHGPGRAGVSSDDLPLPSRDAHLDRASSPRPKPWSQPTGAGADCDVYIASEFRIDVSSEAGSRFDQNITGFRAEEEFGFNAEPYVRTGKFVKILGLCAVLSGTGPNGRTAVPLSWSGASGEAGPPPGGDESSGGPRPTSGSRL
jgi:hypothetical protein